MLGILPHSRPHSSGYYVTESGKVYHPLSDDYLSPIAGRVRLRGQWYTVTLLVASLYCPRPTGATRIRKRRGQSNHYSNLIWIKPEQHTPRAILQYNDLEFPTVKDLAKHLAVSSMKVHRMIKSGVVTRRSAVSESNPHLSTSSAADTE